MAQGSEERVEKTARVDICNVAFRGRGLGLLLHILELLPSLRLGLVGISD